MAVRQAVQRAPHYPESHNINGLVSEVRSDFQSAIASYRQAKFALDMMRNSKTDCRCHIADISVNLARSLCKVRVLSSALMTTKKNPYQAAERSCYFKCFMRNKFAFSVTLFTNVYGTVIL
jgi:hypothetical protein